MAQSESAVAVLGKILGGLALTIWETTTAKRNGAATASLDERKLGTVITATHSFNV